MIQRTLKYPLFIYIILLFFQEGLVSVSTLKVLNLNKLLAKNIVYEPEKVKYLVI